MSLKHSLKIELLLEQISLGIIGFNVSIASYSIKPSWKKLYTVMNANSRSTQYRLRQQIKRLEGNGIIQLEKNEYRLSARGKRLLKERALRGNAPAKSNWDGRWRFVSYDIPAEKSRVRNPFRNTLKSWGFYLVQKSLWVFPWECTDEVTALAHSMDIAPFIICMSTHHIPMEQRLKKHFNL